VACTLPDQPHTAVVVRDGGRQPRRGERGDGRSDAGVHEVSIVVEDRELEAQGPHRLEGLHAQVAQRQRPRRHQHLSDRPRQYLTALRLLTRRVSVPDARGKRGHGHLDS